MKNKDAKQEVAAMMSEKKFFDIFLRLETDCAESVNARDVTRSLRSMLEGSEMGEYQVLTCVEKRRIWTWYPDSYPNANLKGTWENYVTTCPSLYTEDDYHRIVQRIGTEPAEWYVWSNERPVLPPKQRDYR